MDPSLPNVDYSDFIIKPQDFSECYRDIKEQLPRDMLVPRGFGLSTTAFVDISFAQSKKTRKSHTSFIIFVNIPPIIWFSK